MTSSAEMSELHALVRRSNYRIEYNYLVALNGIKM